LEYFAERIGPQWIASEMRLGEAAHPIARWAVELNRDRRSQPAGIGVVKRKVNNASRSLPEAPKSLQDLAETEPMPLTNLERFGIKRADPARFRVFK
jgi:hypothetical protein